MTERIELSTPLAYVYRLIVPALLTVFAVYLVLHYSRIGGAQIVDVVDALTGAGAAAILVVLARLFDRAKRIWIEGDNLHIFDYRRTIVVPLSNVESVWQTPYFRPERICIRFRQPTAFGSQVVFFPLSSRHSTSMQHPIVDELRQRAGLI